MNGGMNPQSKSVNSSNSIKINVGRKRKTKSLTSVAKNETEKEKRARSVRNTKHSNGYNTKGTQQECSMCGVQESESQSIVNLSANGMMRQTLITIWNVPLESVDSKLSSLCVQCVYKINAHREVTRSLQIRLHRVTNGSTTSSQPARPKTSTKGAKNGAPMSKTKMSSTSLETPQKMRGIEASDVTQLLPSPNLSNASEVNANEFNGKIPIENEVSTVSNFEPANATNAKKMTNRKRKKGAMQQEQKKPVTSQTEDGEDRIYEQINVNNVPPTPSVHSEANSSDSESETDNELMLQVICERPESTLITESGGQVNKYKMDPVQMVCKCCQRIYWRKDYYTKHIRRCHARHRYAASVRTNKSQGDNQSVATGLRLIEDLSELESETDEQSTTKTVTVKRIYHCKNCPVTVASLTKLREHSRIHLRRFYCEICGSEFTTIHDYEFHHTVCSAKNEVMKEAKTSAGKSKSVRMTRARTRATSRPPSALSSLGIGLTFGGFGGFANYFRARATGNIRRETDNDEDEGASVVDTMYTNRMRFTGHWVEDNSNSSSQLSWEENDFCDYDEDMPINSYKEYNLYLLDRLKAEMYVRFYTCYDKDCNYSAETMLKMMVHDYVNHFKNAWFYCGKCGRVFTSRVFLDYHLDRQNGGRFMCFRCGDIFEFQNQLDRHLLRHSKSLNYRCNYCKFEFLTENELLHHCEMERHEPNGERRLIRIDPNMVIVNNDAPPDEPYKRGVYTIKEYDIRTPKLPTKRPMQLRGNKPFRLLIGDIEFKDQRNPNCWGWK